MRKNTRGWHRELWNHSQGCRQWFVVERNTITYQIAGSSKLASSAESTSLDSENRAD